jgi:hypothetical protein
MRTLGRGFPTDPLVALRTDAVRGLPDELVRDPRLAAADRIEAEPLVADLEPPAPRAMKEQPPSGARLAQHLGEPGDASGIDAQRASPLVRSSALLTRSSYGRSLASSRVNIAPNRAGDNRAGRD